MLRIRSEITGKSAYYGDVKDPFAREGFVLGGNWGYDGGYFDGVLFREGGETVYLRVPVVVREGELDRDDAMLEFQEPFIVKHVVNVGIDEGSSVLDMTGLSQFQEPVEQDGELGEADAWRTKGEEALARILRYL
ncbi:YugN-like family protein [Bacillaceae bacterium]